MHRPLAKLAKGVRRHKLAKLEVRLERERKITADTNEIQKAIFLKHTRYG